MTDLTEKPIKNILVTGGAGFIGSNFIHYILNTEPQAVIINLDALTYAGRPENLAGLPDASRHIFIHGDICDQILVQQIFRKYAIDSVVHFAAESHVDRSIHDPGQFVQTNVMGTYSLLESARQYWLVEKGIPVSDVRFHHISTDEVFGSLSPRDPPFSETTPYAPNSPYAASKAASDHLVRAYWHTYGLPVTISNCSNNYGPRQFPEKLIPLMILNAQSGNPLPIYGDGKQIRDWLYVEDHCQAIHKILQQGKPGETYNIGGNNQPTNLTIVELLCDIIDEWLPQSHFLPHKQLIQFVADRPGHDRRYAMDTSKIQRELHWQPQHDLQGGLLRTIEWYLSNPGWIEAISKHGDYQSWLQKNYQGRGSEK